MIELTDEQRCELDQGQPARARDPKTNETYVLVRADVYEKMRAIIDASARRAGWDDAELDVYEKYRKKASDVRKWSWWTGHLATAPAVNSDPQWWCKRIS